MRTSGFIKDSPGKFGPTADNLGYKERLAWTLGKEVDVEGPLHVDILSQNKMLLSNVNIVFKLFRNKPEFYLMQAASDAVKHKIKILEASLLVRRVKINPSVQMAHEIALQKKNACYPITRCEVKAISISKGLTSTNCDNIFLGILPKRIICFFVDQENYNGQVLFKIK